MSSRKHKVKVSRVHDGKLHHEEHHFRLFEDALAFVEGIEDCIIKIYNGLDELVHSKGHFDCDDESYA
jgi:hypothetical protein